MNLSHTDRRLFPRYSLRVPIRFRATDLTTDLDEHLVESTNISRSGVFFTTRKPLRVGMPLEMQLRIPVEISGMDCLDAICTGRIVHEQLLGGDRIGYGVQISRFSPPVMRDQEKGGSSLRDI